MSSLTPPPPPPYLPPPPPPVPARRTRRLVAAGVAASVLLVGTGAAGAAVATRLLDDGPTPSAGTTEQGPSTTAQDGTGVAPTSPYAQRGQGFVVPDQGLGSTSAETASDATAEQSAGIVQITSTLTDGTGAGTGLVLTSDGEVVTNHHVVEGATAIKVTDVSTGRTYTARYVGGDAVTDVAVLQLEDASGLTPADLSGDAAQVGDEITAVGDAGGDGGSLTASPGTVSALGQDITVESTDGSGGTELTDLIQMDAYVVPGDSGGAVLDSDGQVVGMNVAASSGSRQVVGYAIPIATVESVVRKIEDGDESGNVGSGYHGYLGVGLDPSATTPLVAQADGGLRRRGRGVAVGDTITKVDGVAVPTAEALQKAIAAKDAGDRVSLTWTGTDGRSHTATATLGEAPVS
ncbi:trypsin-like serine protease [Nocardioides sp. W3-2-3]|uniref:S1C family serine protease n=1 Tax=Nocardioides convexus TaxID=2712224 RepID=UPI0024182284|nr:trypsin-like peptidase domain-containing protein [Nocardioides convexus]NHA00136.1 trypsin-like serine protease [Nocardioides convexus]